jgi:hypothetical protein
MSDLFGEKVLCFMALGFDYIDALLLSNGKIVDVNWWRYE